jgi:DNA primase
VAHVVAPLGTAFTTDQAVLLKRFAPSVVLLFDADAAGKKATFASREPCRVAGLSARVATLPDGKDPDEFVRARGVEALRGCILQSQGLLEYLLDQCLDSTFVSADSRERAGRVEQVAKLLSEEDDPLVRSMAKAYADKLAGRLDLVRSVDAFQALERTVKRALASRAPSAAFEGDRNSRDALDTHAANVVFDPRRARIAPQAPEKRFRADMVGAIIEFPEILADSAVASELNLFEGASALTVAAVGKATRIASTGEKNLDTTVFLSQIPSAVQEFALKRLAAPLYETAEVAKTNFLQKASLLRRLILSRETEEISRSQQKVQGDWQAEVELAQEAYERMRQKHGLPPQRSPIPTNATNSTNSRNATQSIESNATQSTDDDDDNP